MTSFITLKHPFTLLLLSSLFLNALLWFLAIYFFPKDHQLAVLHYSVDVGIDFIGQGHQIIVLPIAGLIIWLGNTFIGLAIKQVDQTTSWVLWSVTPLVQIILILAFFLIWQVNS